MHRNSITNDSSYDSLAYVHVQFVLLIGSSLG
jgi:hypothetical protein